MTKFQRWTASRLLFAGIRTMEEYWVRLQRGSMRELFVGMGQFCILPTVVLRQSHHVMKWHRTTRTNTHTHAKLVK